MELSHLWVRRSASCAACSRTGRVPARRRWLKPVPGSTTHCPSTSGPHDRLGRSLHSVHTQGSQSLQKGKLYQVVEILNVVSQIFWLTLSNRPHSANSLRLAYQILGQSVFTIILKLFQIIHMVCGIRFQRPWNVINM